MQRDYDKSATRTVEQPNDAELDAHIREEFDRLTRETPMMTFWRALNTSLAESGYPELTFGQVRAIHEDAFEAARRVARHNAA